MKTTKALLQRDLPQNYLFTNEQLKNLIIPLIFETGLAITVGMADTMMIASAGEAAISGVSLVDMFNNLIIQVLAALATGGAVVTSQFLGAGDKKKACGSIRQLTYSCCAITIAISVLLMIFNRPVIRFFYGKIDADVFASASLYMVLSAISFPFLSIYNSAAAVFRSMGRSKVTLRVSIVMNLINVSGNAIGIFLLHAGVAGVAIPSVISRAVAGIMLYRMLRDESLEIHLLKEPFRVDFSVIRKIFYIGIPSGIENGIFQFGRVIVVSVISGFGTAQIAANGVANSLDAMGLIGAQAVNLSLITVIGRCVGAGSKEQVRYYTKKLIAICYLVIFCFCGLTLIFLKPILSFYHLGPEATRIAGILVLIHNGCALLLWPLSFSLPNTLRACNDVRFTMVVAIASMFTFRVGLSYVMGVNLGMGAVGVWLAMIVDWLVRITCFLTRYLRGSWIRSAHLENSTS